MGTGAKEKSPYWARASAASDRSYRMFSGQEGADIWVLKVMQKRKGHSLELIDALIKRLEMLKTTER